MIISKVNAKENLGESISLPLQKRKQNKISRFSFAIVSVWMVASRLSIVDRSLPNIGVAEHGCLGHTFPRA